MLSEKTRVLRARRGSPEKKSVSLRCPSLGPSCQQVSGSPPLPDSPPAQHLHPMAAQGVACVRFLGIVGGRLRPHVRCLRGPAQSGCRGTCLKQGDRDRVRMIGHRVLSPPRVFVDGSCLLPPQHELHAAPMAAWSRWKDVWTLDDVLSCPRRRLLSCWYS